MSKNQWISGKECRPDQRLCSLASYLEFVCSGLSVPKLRVTIVNIIVTNMYQNMVVVITIKYGCFVYIPVSHSCR